MKPSPSSAERRRLIREVILALGPGEVVSYGDVATDAGVPGQARLVGRLLAESDGVLPWWRVVNAAGRLVPGLEETQATLLVREGVAVQGNRVIAAPVGRFSRARRPAAHG
jgi:methylated-DNA-protein-cysteine methyltransferase-like protein